MANISIAEAANRLDLKPWDVIRLADAGLIQKVTLIDETSVTEMLEAKR